MDRSTKARCEARANIIKALAHPTRLYIIEQLSEGERCVCELRDGVGADISTVSKHLSILKNAGLVVDRKEGLWIYYRLRCTCITAFLECVESMQKSRAEDQLAACTC
jgi:ArsR family transcriptional regulator, arsenate/arsenite/antimonite-responsive transcriptional repressor